MSKNTCSRIWFNNKGCIIFKYSQYRNQNMLINTGSEQNKCNINVDKSASYITTSKLGLILIIQVVQQVE